MSFLQKSVGIHVLRLGLLVIAVPLLAACSSDSSPAPAGCEAGSGTGSFTVNGVRHAVTCVLVGTTGGIAIYDPYVDNAAEYTIDIAGPSPTAVGTYQLTGDRTQNRIPYASVESGIYGPSGHVTGEWDTSATKTGTVTITSLNAQTMEVKGTFSLEAVPTDPDSTAGNLEITDGTFQAIMQVPSR